MGKGAVRRTRKKIEEVVQYALGHKIRIQVLVALNEGNFTAAEISRKIDVPQKTLQNHLHRMLEDGSIEIDETRHTGNQTQYRYRSVVLNLYTAEEFERLSYLHRQHIVGAILNSGIAEIMAGFHAGKLAEPRAHEFWDWYNVDEKGRDDADALLHRCLRGLHEIEAESMARAAAGDGKTTSMLLELFFFERPRRGAGPAHRFAPEQAPRTMPPPVSSRRRAAQRYFGWGDHHPPPA